MTIETRCRPSDCREMPQDPFVGVRDDVKANLEQAELLLESYKRLAQTTTTSSPEVVQTLEDLDQVLEDITADVADLEDSVEIVSDDPAKYNVTTTELERRRGFIQNIKRECERIRSAARPQNPFKSAADPAGEDDDAGHDDDAGTEEDRRQEQLYQEQMMQQQDDQLDSVFHTVGNLRMQARDMGQELGTQAEMLEEFEIAADRSASRLRRGMKNLEEFIKKNEVSFVWQALYRV